MYSDTIAAISTPIGEGGIGIVRLSGENSRSIAETLFDKKLENRRLVYGHINDPETGRSIDEVLIAYMQSPHTYTREDIVEINCHSGPLPLQSILELVLHHGARLAHPGEFTLRSFLNGRIDLAQAESVMDVIQAKTQAGLNLAVQGLNGKLSKPIRKIRTDLMLILAYLTAKIDFPEDDIEDQDIVQPLEFALLALGDIIDNADKGIIYRQGVRTAIVGRPNVGKSSLLNLLLRENRAIVTSVPGTTRDTIEETVNIHGIPFVLIDTAGIIDSKDMVESIAIKRSRNAIAQSEFVLFVVDSSEPLTIQDDQFIQILSDKSVLLVANKSDLPLQADLNHLPWLPLSTSATEGEGLAELESAMACSVLGGSVSTTDSMLVTNPRHKEALIRAVQHLIQARDSAKAVLPEDFITIDLTAALNALGEITGETVTEDLINTIFSRFCIGK